MTGRGASGMDTEYRSRLVAHLLALKDAPNTTLLDRVQAIGVTAARHMLFDKAVRLQHTDQQTAMECAAEGQPGSRLKPFDFDDRRRLLSRSRSVLSKSAMILARSRTTSRAADSKRLRRRII